MNGWYARAMEQLEEELHNNEIDYATFKQQMRYITDELKLGAEEASIDAYNDYMQDY